MPANSKAYAAQDALKALIATALPTVQVSLGTPARMPEEAVWVSGEIDDWAQAYAVSGLQASDETFTLRVHCLTTWTGDYAGMRARIKTLSDSIETAVKAAPTLSGAVELIRPDSFVLEEALVDDRRRQGLLTIFFACRAWLA